jgi:hypothetical protein
MQARKLDRARRLVEPAGPFFTIERHGETVHGASPAELHRWSVDMHERIVSEEDIASYYRPLRDST